MTPAWNRLLELPRDARERALTEELRSLVAAGLRIPRERIGVAAPCPPDKLYQLVRPQLGERLGLMLYGHDIEHCWSIQALARHLTTELEAHLEPGSSEPLDFPAEEPDTSAPVGDAKNPPACLLLSSPRSGSTLLRNMLDRNTRLFAPPELHLLPFVSMGRRARHLEETGNDWSRSGLLSALMKAEELTPAAAAERVAALERDDVPVQEVYALLQRSRAWLVDKTPRYSFRLAWLRRAEAIFDAPRYLHLVRHPYAMMESYVRMRFHRLIGVPGVADPNPWRAAERCWLLSNRNILALRQVVPPSRQLVVSYEALVANPREQLARISELLGVPFESAMLEPYSNRGSTAELGDPNFLKYRGIEPSLGESWKRHKPPRELVAETRELALELGYELT